MAENEAFDKLFAEKMTGSKLKFRFEPSFVEHALCENKPVHVQL